MRLDLDTANEFTEGVSFNVANYYNSSDEANKGLVPAYIKLNYIQHITAYSPDPFVYPSDTDQYPPSTQSQGTIVRSAEYLDNIFLPFDMVNKWINANTKVRSSVYYEGAYVDNVRGSGRDFMANVGLAIDSDAGGGGITLFAFNNSSNGNSPQKGYLDRSFSLSGETYNNDDSFLKNVGEVSQSAYGLYATG